MRPSAAIVWHWGRCNACGALVYVRETDLLFDAVKPGCCGATAESFEVGVKIDPERAHAKGDAPALRCLACGYEKTFGAPPVGAERDDEMKKKKTKGAPLNGTTPPKKNGAIGTLGEVAKVTRSEPVERKRYRQPLPCKIDESLSHAKGLELARVCRERKEFEEERANENRAAREQAAYFDETIERLRIEVEGCVETRQVECVDMLLPTGEVQTIRLDTGEVIDTRAAKASELQESLLGVATSGDEPKKGKGKRDTAPAPPPDDIDPPFGEAIP